MSVRSVTWELRESTELVKRDSPRRVHLLAHPHSSDRKHPSHHLLPVRHCRVKKSSPRLCLLLCATQNTFLPLKSCCITAMQRVARSTKSLSNKSAASWTTLSRVASSFHSSMERNPSKTSPGRSLSRSWPPLRRLLELLYVDQCRRRSSTTRRSSRKYLRFLNNLDNVFLGHIYE